MPLSNRILVTCAAGAVLSLAVGFAPEHAPAQPPGPTRATGIGAVPIVDKLTTRTTLATSHFSGKVVNTTEIAFGDTRERHLVAWVQTDEELRPVDLGPVMGENAVAVKKGDSITVTGKPWPVVETRRTEIVFASQVKKSKETTPTARPKNSENGKPKAQTLHGEIVRTKRVEWKGSDRRELVILLKTDAGDEVVADLGPTTAFQGAGVKSGEEITLRGAYQSLNDRQVFFATQATTEQKSVAIHRDQPPAAGQKANTPPKTRRVLVGTIRAIDEARRKNEDEPQLLLLVRGQDNRYAIADLGPAAEARALGLRIGEEITVSGPVTHIQDRPVVLAETVSTHGHTLWIDRGK